MKEAVGATWIFGIVIAFIALFSGYLAFSVNYSKAFRIKDGIIDRIEKYSGFNYDAVVEIKNYMAEIRYYSQGSCRLFLNQNKYVGVTQDVVTPNPTSGTYNYCVQRVSSYGRNGELTAAYYQVVVFFSLSIPILRESSNFNIKGETVNIYYPDEVARNGTSYRAYFS